MKQDYFELKENRDFGDIITLYFDFFKQNIKKFTDTFISYNGFFLIGILIVSYLLVSGFIGLITSTPEYSTEINVVPDISYVTYLIAGFILFFIIFIILGVLNFGLSASYMIKYVDAKGMGFDKKEVWALVKERLGSIIGFLLLLILVYIGFLIVSFILAIIPLLGMLVQYVLQFFMSAWIGVSLFAMLYEKRDVADAFGLGWKLVTNNFWKSVGVNFILGLLVGILLMLLLSIPGILIGIYSYHVVDSNLVVSESIFATIIYTLGMCIFLILLIYSHCLTQFINGILFFNLHEKQYNTNTRAKIDQIGE